MKKLAPGNLNVVRPGEKIPTDGEVDGGTNHVDESFTAGESIPVEKTNGTQVLGATMNKEGRLKDIKVVVLDKTGTITRGEPKLTDVPAAGSGHSDRALYLAASVENASEHPLARATVDGARERNIVPAEVNDFGALTARGVKGTVEGSEVLVGNRRLMEESGVAGLETLHEDLERLEAQGRTVVIVSENGRALGLVAVADTVKPDSKAAIKAMHEIGLRVAMLTGDNERAANAVADVAIEAADITLVKGELPKAVEAIRLSRFTFRKIVQNLFWAFFYNVAAIPIAAIGLLHPMIGVIAMTTSSLSVIGNSILLKRARLTIE